MGDFVPLHVHNYYSLQDGSSRPSDVARRVRQCGYGAVAITNHGNLASAVAHVKANKDVCKHCGYASSSHDESGRCLVSDANCKGFEKEPLKSIQGCELYVCNKDSLIKDDSNRSLYHLCVLAKNKQGWLNLVKAVNNANLPDNFYYKPRLSLEKYASYANNQWIAFSGHPGSLLANMVFAEPKKAYRARTYEEAKSFAKPWVDLQRELVEAVRHHQDLFGVDNFFIEVQMIDAVNLPAAQIIGKTMRWLAKRTGVKAIATPDAHYANKEDAADQRILLCSSVGTTLRQAQDKLAADEDFGLSQFFRSNRYHIPSLDELKEVHEETELTNTIAVADMCESYDITGPPRIPQFDCPNRLSPEDYLLQLCREGWVNKCQGKVPLQKYKEYGDRLRYEMSVLGPIGLAPYFLIVWDFCRYAQKDLGCMPSPGRGSAAGCLISYLLNVADCDPIKYNLLFERFYNAGRNTKDNISLPDIDVDIPTTKREPLLKYIRNKYGDSHVAQIATFGSLAGKGALKEVFRAHDWGTYDQRNEISHFIPDNAAISDQLQEQLEEEGQQSAILWALEHNKSDLKQYCEVDDDGNLTGELAPYFRQAMRLEGVKKQQGRHAAGLIISPDSLMDICPMVYDKGTKRLIGGMEYPHLEEMGFAKYDVLGLAILDKLQGAIKTIATGRVHHG